MILGQSKLAPTIGQFVVFRVSEDGLSRIDGKRTFDRQSYAEDHAKSLAVKHPQAHFTVLQVKGSFWHTPAPEILTDIERHKAAAE